MPSPIKVNILRWRLTIDVQARYLSRAIRWTLAGGALTMLVWVWILFNKMG